MLKCLHCQAGLDLGNRFRKVKRGNLDVYQRKVCRGIYNLTSGTVLEDRHFTPEQTVLFLQKVLKGKSSARLTRELNISCTIAMEFRYLLQAKFAMALVISRLL